MRVRLRAEVRLVRADLLYNKVVFIHSKTFKRLTGAEAYGGREIYDGLMSGHTAALRNGYGIRLVTAAPLVTAI